MENCECFFSIFLKPRVLAGATNCKSPFHTKQSFQTLYKNHRKFRVDSCSVLSSVIFNYLT